MYTYILSIKQNIVVKIITRDLLRFLGPVRSVHFFYTNKNK